ncbi:MAG: sigma-70 family RNA polymerase sigma factor [Streptosporangiaceae bacterium]
MTEDLIERVKAGDEHAFRQLVGPYQGELQLHCYRILGSAQDAEDALQETLLGAWRGLAQFEGRSSVRTWLYRVATNCCLKALRSASRRPPVNWPPPGVEVPTPSRVGEVIWLQPYPDMLLAGLPDATPGPEARYEASETISLAFVTACRPCHPGSAPSSSCAMSSASPPARSPASWTAARTRPPARSSAPAPPCAASSRPQPPGR